MSNFCAGCGYSVEECNDCKELGYIACCPDCKHVKEEDKVKELKNLINILEELKEDYFEGALTEFDVTKVLMDNIDDLTEALNECNCLREQMNWL